MMMEWGSEQVLLHQLQQKEQPNLNFMNHNGGGGGGGAMTVMGGVLHVKVMTDEQLEILRKQISVYTTICDLLLNTYTSLSANHDQSGVKLGTPYYDLSVAPISHRIPGKQRWTPTPVQLQILERIFEKGSGTPSKQRIKEIASELSEHGQISETNVYNWFQNRRARSKRKQLQAPVNSTETEKENELNSPDEKNTDSDKVCSKQEPLQRAEDLCSQGPITTSEMHSDTFPSAENGVKPSGNLGQASFCESTLSKPGGSHSIKKLEAPAGYDLYY